MSFMRQIDISAALEMLRRVRAAVAGGPAGHLLVLAAAGLIVGAAALPCSAVQDTAASRPTADILATRCLSCHDASKRAGGIDLSTRSTAAAVLAGGGDSRLARAVAIGKMPPTGRLPDAGRALIERWAAAGAPYPVARLEAAPPAMAPLWSFKPVRRPAVPHSRYDSLSANPVDRFLFAALAKKGLKPSPPADRRTLLRRVTVDLTGLPPTPDETAAFLADRRPDAYERVVDRLLASPAYGERWGRHWLDVVRYGESNGYEQNHLRPDAWPYRDYVIRAFNEDIPYPRFIAEQLAGDALAAEDPRTGAATGFLVAGTHDTVPIQTDEGTRQQRSNDLEDIVSTTGAAFLGLTVGCARCHDHKFDPIPQRDYYRLEACFAGVRHGSRPLRPQTDADRKAESAAAARIQALQNGINAIDGAARAAVLRSRGVTPLARPAVNARRNEDTFAPTAARFVRFTVLATNDGAEPCLDELQVFGPGSNADLALASAGAKARASSLLPGYAIHQVPHLNDGKFGNEHSWISNTRGAGWAQIELAAERTIDTVVWSRDGAEIPRFDDRIPTRYRIEVSRDGAAWTVVSTEAGRAGTTDYVHPDELQRAMTAEQRARRQTLAADLRTENDRVAAIRGGDRAYIGQFTAPDPIFVLRRGDVMQRGDEVTPGALSQIGELDSTLLRSGTASEPERRLALARWIGNPANPLTARVFVNRVWQEHFGRGIVGTPSDFGRNGEKPTHPEMLDWLASEFMARGWRLKPLHRLIVTSYAYRQSSAVTAEGQARDAGNVLLWRMNLRRMEAEAVRDAVLETSGKLDRTMGGPSFRLYRYNVVNVAIYEPLEAYGPETWRRAVYQQAARGIRDDLLGAFDCPESSQRAPRRESTTTALQALSLLNGPFLMQQAGFLADRIRKEAGGQAEARVRRSFDLAFQRSPDPDELASSLALVRRDGLTELCRALLNANEFLYY
ncbi:MAG TPA: DUF1553 domain-containing protein [Chthonomonadaceae bacterium]|nr:DUF1553 domain-containing protein [Chthonomonadaceae bacterium]